MKKYGILFFLLFITLTSFGQYKAFGFKAGLTAGMQVWNGFQRQPLLGYNASYLTERVNENGTSYFADIGYHLKGSAIRTRFVTQNNEIINSTLKFKFHQASLLLGAKKRFAVNDKDAYYLFGFRVEYTIADSLQTFQLPDGAFRRVTYGPTIGGGIEIPIGNSNELFFEITVSPDFAPVIYIPPGGISYYNRITNTYFPLSEQKVLNLSLEITVGYKFLRSLAHLYE